MLISKGNTGTLHQKCAAILCFLQFAFLLQQAHFTSSFSFSSQSNNPQSQSQSQPQQTPVTKYSPHLQTKIASSVAKTERRLKERSYQPRTVCNHCKRPPILCICPSLPPQLISTSTNILILQHPREFRRRSLSTVPLMPLVLENCRIQVGYSFNFEFNSEEDEHQLVTGIGDGLVGTGSGTGPGCEFVRECLARGQKPLLLFPGENAISLDRRELEEDNDNNGDDYSDSGDIGGQKEQKDEEYNNQVQQLKNGQQLLIIIDGTWAEAKRMIKESPTLVAMCQQVQFTADYESIYDIVRKEPEKHCISTLEACSHALTLLEPEERRGGEAKEWLEGSMKYMVETKMNVHDLRNGTPEPRFARPGVKTYERNKRRFQIKEELFNKMKESHVLRLDV